MPGSVERRPPGVMLAVWLTWAAMTAGALGLVARYGSNVPSWDDWDMVPTLTHAQPISVGWLWSQHNEHRVPLPRLLYLAVNRMTGTDFRATMVVDALAMAAVAAAMIMTARRRRGPSLADAFFPLVLLHWGQAANLLWGWQLQFFCSVVLACIALVAIVRTEPGADLGRSATTVGVCAVLLTLSGANGLGLVPALAAWPLAMALGPPRCTGAARPGGPGARIAATLALVLIAVYFVHWQPVPYHPKSHSVHQTLKTALQFLAIGLGPAGHVWWPFSEYAVLLLGAATVGLLVWVWRSRPVERPRALGLFLFLGAMSSLALGLGLGRDGFETRYVTLAAPAWCATYFVWRLYGPGLVRRGVPALLAASAVVALVPNVRFGLEYASDLRAHLSAFERDLAAGVPAYELIRRYGPWLHPHQDIVADYLRLLARAQVGPYARLRADPSFTSIPVPLEPVQTVQLSWRDSVARVEGPDPAVVFELPENHQVAGIRLAYRYRADDGTLPYIAIHWKTGGERSYDLARFYKYSPTGDRANWERGAWTRIHDSTTTLTLWIDDTVKQIRITPDFRPATFRVADLSLLVPERQ
ncbi:MAG: hypothetical protein ACTHM9_03520 [Gemmatimonadales bacterium]